MRQDRRAETFFVPKATGRFPDGLDLGIELFHSSLGDVVLDIIENSIETVSQGFGCFLHELQPEVACPEIPLLPEAPSPGAASVFPEVSRILLDGPASSSFQITRPHRVEVPPVLLREIFSRIKQNELQSCQCGSTDRWRTCQASSQPIPRIFLATWMQVWPRTSITKRLKSMVKRAVGSVHGSFN